MGRIMVMNHLTLDGVMQGPGRPDEDTHGGFTHGGWANISTTADDETGKVMRQRIAAGGGLAAWLFGRRTYDDLLGYWNREGGPFKDALNQARKYIVSATLSDPMPWPNSTLLSGNIPESVRALKEQTKGVLGIMGSGELINSLFSTGLIDEYLLMIHPLVLGAGRRLFPEHIKLQMQLIDCVTSSTGIVIASYESKV